MKLKYCLAALLCSLACLSMLRAQSGQAIAVSSRSETQLRVLSQSDNGLEFSNRLSGVDKAIESTLQEDSYTAASLAEIPQHFTTLTIDGYTFTNKVGCPKLPVRVELIEIPEGASLRVVYGRTSYKDINLAKAGYSLPIVPAQPPLSKSARQKPAFVYNAEAYRVDAFVTPGDTKDLVEVQVLGEMRGVRLAKVMVKPVQYNAVKHTLRVYTDIDFEIVFDNADWQKTAEKRNKYASSAFGFLRHEVANPSKAVEVTAPLRYVMVADPLFKDSLQKFANWKARLGFDVVQAYTDQPEVGNTAESIRAYLKGLYENATETEPAPSYVLLVGDLAQVPTKTYGTADFWGDGVHYSDLYLCEYTDDRFPEIHYGRMSANTVEELMPQINKTIYMESLTPERARYLDTCLAIAGSDDGRYDNVHLNPTINYICGYYMPDTLTRYVYKYLNPESSGSAREIIKNFDDGVAVALYTAHGNYDGWSDPSFNINNVNQLTNKGKYAMAIGNCCLTGKFDESVCFGEALLRKQDAGAVIYIGASDVTYFDQDVYWAIGYTERIANGLAQTYEKTELGAFDVLNHTHGEAYEDWALTAHEMVYAGNMAVQRANQDLEDYYWEVYHVFGDPSYMPYTYRPVSPKYESAGAIVYGENVFSVRTEPYARVSISREGVNYGTATANANGLVDVTVRELPEPGLYDLTVIAQNFLPLHQQLDVVSPDRKYITVSVCELLDAQDNPVRNVLYGQTYRARLTLRNVGNDDVNKVQIKFVSPDGYLEVDNGYTYTESFRKGEEKTLEHLFTVKVSPNVPHNYMLPYSIELVADDETDNMVSKDFRVLALAPDLKVVSFELDDSESGNGNGVLDNGETIKATVKVQNLSNLEAAEAKVKVSSDAIFLTVPEEEKSLGDLPEGQTAEFTFSFSAKDAGVYYALYCLDFTFTTKERTTVDTVKSYVGPVVETFESGDFSFVEWKESSDWVIDNTVFHNGKFSASSAPVADGASSTLKIDVNVPIDDKVGFYYRTSSEVVNGVLGDFLTFYIDGVRQGRWAGISSDWEYVEYPVSAGVHTLRWDYTKDASESAGEDKVWLDDIRLPIGSHAPVGNVANEKRGRAGESILRVHAGSGRIDVEYNTEKTCHGSLYIVNVQGQRVKTLANDLYLQGRGVESFPLNGLASGMYILVFEEAKGAGQAVKFIVAE